MVASYTHINPNNGWYICFTVLFVGAAMVAFDQCRTKERISDERGSYSHRIHYHYDFIEDFQDLFADNGPKIESSESSESSPEHNSYS